MLRDGGEPRGQVAGVDIEGARDLLEKLIPQVNAHFRAHRADPASVDLNRYARLLKLLERTLDLCETHLEPDARYHLRLSLQNQVFMLGLDPLFAVAPAPRGVNIQLTNRCNLRCIMCHHDRLSVPTRDMPLRQARDVLDQCADLGVASVCLQNFGESFLYRELPQAIAHGASRGLEVTVVSNGTALPEAMARAVVEAGLHKVVFSVEGHTAERYEAIRVGARFERVRRNIVRLKRIRDELDSDLRIEMHTELYEEGEEFKREYEAFWSDCADRFSYAKLTPFPGIEYLDRDGERVRFGGEPRHEPTSCLSPFRCAVVKSNGDVVPCCVDQNHDLVMGNVFEQGLAAVWTGRRYRDLREAARRSDYGDHGLCRTCPNMARDTAVEKVG